MHKVDDALVGAVLYIPNENVQWDTAFPEHRLKYITKDLGG